MIEHWILGGFPKMFRSTKPVFRSWEQVMGAWERIQTIHEDLLFYHSMAVNISDGRSGRSQWLKPFKYFNPKMHLRLVCRKILLLLALLGIQKVATVSTHRSLASECSFSIASVRGDPCRGHQTGLV